MSELNFGQVFKAATEFEPFGYQCRLACGDGADPKNVESLRNGAACESKLISIPTGLGKTAAVILAWLWNRLLIPDEAHRASWPRRLVYCLPMRTLVEQTRDNVSVWLTRLAYAAALDEQIVEKRIGELSEESRKRLAAVRTGCRQSNHLSHAKDDLLWLLEHSPVVLMGGEELDNARRDWDLYPERAAILIGTQDMLLSRALNRGYAMSRYRWPMHFGLLNNDSLWVLDETQLMGVGVETSAQLDGFRREEEIGAQPACSTWWMSATLDEAQLATIDHPKPDGGWPVIQLGQDDLALPAVRDRYNAKKKISRAALALGSADKAEYARSLAHFIVERHQRAPDNLTLVVVNNVRRAQDVYEQLQKTRAADRIALIHSRFRPPDRKRPDEILYAGGARIVVATQAVEAGVDVSARVLITELAPWSSLVQRFGRSNRYGEFEEGAEIFWIDIKLRDEKDELALPYSLDELKIARELLERLGDDAGPRSLREKIDYRPPREIRPVIRRKDLFDVFDTTPDLCGNDLDVSRYVRDGDDTDVRVYWREVPEDAPPPDDEPRPQRDELCAVSLRSFAGFLQKAKKKRLRVLRWNPVEEKWDESNRARPGQVYLLAREAGAYSDVLGWTGDPGDKPASVFPPPRHELRDSGSRDPDSFTGQFVLLDKHTRDVGEELKKLVGALVLNDETAAALCVAARWHDVGKAHEEFQKMLHAGTPSDYALELLAKSKNQEGRCARRCFRHELASALAWLQNAPADAPTPDLVAFLVAAHHGKVRLSIRSLPNETPPLEADRLYARGIWDGDSLPGPPFENFSVNGQTITRFQLDLSLMQLGDGPRGPSWLARMVALRDTLGPFRLAWLETLLRVADARASAAEQQPQQQA